MKAKLLPIGFDKQRFLQLVDSTGVDGILLTSPENISYVTGYPCLPSSGNPILFAIRNHYPFYCYINKKAEVFLVAWEYSLLDIELGVDHLVKHVNKDLAWAGLAKLLPQQLGRNKMMGIEGSCPYQIVQMVEEWATPAKIKMIDGLFDQLRLIKSVKEIEALKYSCNIAEKTFTDLVPLIQPGLKRSDLIAASKQGMLHHGATGIGHCTISFGASNPEVEINETLEKDRLVIIDLGAMQYGYASDIRRMLYTGKIPDKMQHLHSVMCGIVETIGNSLVPGAVVKDICSLAESLYIQNGLDPNFTHFGHTIGLQTEEIWCDRKNEMKLEKGMVINVELYSMMSSGENIGDEETYLVTDGEPVCLNQLPKPILEVNG